MRRSVLFSVTAVVLLLAFGASNALAAGAGAVSQTQVFHNATQSFADVDPCTGTRGTVTITFNGVFHVTTLANGTFWATGTQTGTFVFTPTDPTKPTDTGRFTVWFGDNDNLRNDAETSTAVIRGTRSDGTSFVFHDVEHLNTTANGITFSFSKPTCG
jgi:hypothetical protein